MHAAFFFLISYNKNKREKKTHMDKVKFRVIEVLKFVETIGPVFLTAKFSISHCSGSRRRRGLCRLGAANATEPILVHIAY